MCGRSRCPTRCSGHIRPSGPMPRPARDRRPLQQIDRPRRREMTDTHPDAHAHAHGGPKHPYHLVDPSPWPIVGAIAAGLLAIGGVLYMHGHGWALMAIGLICVLGTMAGWWRDVIRQATF